MNDEQTAQKADDDAEARRVSADAATSEPDDVGPRRLLRACGRVL